jgi:hypothetical protein
MRSSSSIYLLEMKLKRESVFNEGGFLDKVNLKKVGFNLYFDVFKMVGVPRSDRSFGEIKSPLEMKLKRKNSFSEGV